MSELRSPLFVATAATLIVALLFGGGTVAGLWSDAVVQLVSLPLLFLVGWHLRSRTLNSLERAALLIAAGAASVLLLQLVPLSPSLWTRLPGRDIVAVAYAQIGIALPWLPASLDPHATLLAALSLLPALAVFGGTMLLDTRARRKLTVVIIGFALASVVIGLAQVQLGQQRTVGLYAGSGYESSGLFANRNHFAALLYVAMPLTAAWIIGLIVDRRPAAARRAVLLILLYAALLLGLGMARSRAGLALACVAGAASLLFAWSSSRSTQRSRTATLVFSGTALGVLLVVNFALLRILERLDSDIAEDYRFDIARVGAQALWAYFPAGAGFGTFTRVYEIFEPVAALRTVYAYHAHNDWLELVLEGGLPAAVLMAGFLAWMACAVARNWRWVPGARTGLDVMIQRAAIAGAGLLLLHSLVDYPLRTTALLAIFGFLCGATVNQGLPERVRAKRFKRPGAAVATGEAAGAR